MAGKMILSFFFPRFFPPNLTSLLLIDIQLAGKITNGGGRKEKSFLFFFGRPFLFLSRLIKRFHLVLVRQNKHVNLTSATCRLKIGDCQQVTGLFVSGFLIGWVYLEIYPFSFFSLVEFFLHLQTLHSYIYIYIYIYICVCVCVCVYVYLYS